MRLNITVNYQQRFATASIELNGKGVADLSLEIERDDENHWVLWAVDGHGREPIGAYSTWSDAVAAFSQTIVFEVGHGHE
jgi:hypothetical protein